MASKFENNSLKDTARKLRLAHPAEGLVSPKNRYTKPQLCLIHPAEPQWRHLLPTVRKLVQQALVKVDDGGVPDVAEKLRALLELIDREIAMAEDDSS